MIKIEGTAVVMSGGATSGTVIEVKNSDGDVVDQVRADDYGHFTYHLSPGTWTFQCWDAEGHRGAETVALAAEDATKRVDIRLT